MLINSELKNIIGAQNFYELKARLLKQEQAFFTYTSTVQENLQYMQNVSKCNEFFIKQNNLFDEYTRLSQEVIQYLQVIVINYMMNSPLLQAQDLLENSDFTTLLQKELDKHDYSIDFFPCLVKNDSVVDIACEVTEDFVEDANTQDLLLTIFIVTYNHEDTIAQCIESIVNQLTQYRYKIYLLEDCSTDNTLAICKEYAQKYADRIELIAQPVNTFRLGKTESVYGFGSERHTLFAKKNLIKTNYYFMIEGDDYLIDKSTIQRAITFLEQHKDYVGFCSSFLHYYMENGIINIDPQSKTAFSNFNADVYKYSHTSTRFYRNIIDMNTYKNFESYFDTTLWHEYLMRGDFFFYNKAVSLYRRKNGEWGSLSKEKQDEGIATTMQFRKERRKIYLNQTEDPHLRPEYKDFFTNKNFFKSIEAVLLNNNIPNFSQVEAYKYFKDKEAELKKIYSYLADEASKKQYLCEINRIIISSLVGYEESVKYFNNMSYEEHKKHIEIASSGNYPKFKLFIKGKVVETTPTGTFVIEEYRYKDVFIVEKNDIIIDGGGYCGETAAWFLENGAKEVHLFEPLEFHHTLIEQNISNEIKVGKVVVNNKGLSDKEESLTFNENGAGSRISENGTLTINCVSIDDYCTEHSLAPTLIKMDIEGAELKALIGAKNTIMKHRPKLAICLYHKKEDMIDLPMYIKELVPEYDFYCKANHPYWEFVLYAVVNNK